MMQTQHPLVQIQQISPPPHMMLHQHQLAPTIAEVPQTLQPRMLKEINGFQCKVREGSCTGWSLGSDLRG